ncbi:hypothetical protein H312_01033 [Anncaliia algerae PRA339]|uniref:Uncharacterized protein n=1 Tax=Anncaliia algerae PRA339 TaxID=1288291 RepID=A0A059F2W0_9MICR|nr:hypothetical protein H312_01033 [Anncaliia algerae PRA339]
MESINSFIDHLDGTNHSQVKKTNIESVNKFMGENEIINNQTGNFTGMAIASTHKNRDVIGTDDSREIERSLLNSYEVIAGDIIKSKTISLKNIKLREYKIKKENPKLFSRCEWKKIIDIFYRIENDYVFPLAKILNIFFNTQIHIRKKCSMSIDNFTTFFKFLEILKKSYKCKNGINIDEIQLQNHLIFLYKEFREF